MPNIHFGLASRAMLESDEVVAASNVFTVNAVVEGLAGLAAVYESFVPASDRLLVGDGGSDMLLRMWGGAILALAMASFGMRKCDPAPARSAFCVGCALYHAIAASIILHAFFTAEGTALPGAGLVAVLAEKVGMEASELVQRKACAMAAVSSTLSEFVPRLPPR